MDPREIHELEQVRARLREVAAITAMYRAELMEGGISEPEAWASARKLEQRLTDRVLAEWEADRDEAGFRRLLERLDL